jgi:hypothetical protein
MRSNNEFFLLASWHIFTQFVCSMWKWIIRGTKVVPYNVAYKRRRECDICTAGLGKRCPECGCFIKLITMMDTSKCEKW